MARRLTADACRICFVTTEYPPHAGGAARSARRLVRGLARRGFEIVVISAMSPKQPASELPRHDEGVPISWVPFNLDAAIQAVAAEDRRRPFDLFHGFTLPAAVPCLSVAASGRRPVVASIRGVDGVEIDAMAVDVLRGSTWITSVSRDSLTRAMAVTDVSRRSCVIPNSVDIANFVPWQATAANAGVVGTIATFRAKKNIPLLVRAYARLPRGVRRSLLLVGEAYDGEMLSARGRGSIDAAIGEVGVAPEVDAPGFVEHDRLTDYHARMRVFALSSTHEGMPNSLLEAAASGVPIVATAVDGVKDMLTDGHDALLVDARDPDDPGPLAAAFARVLTDEALAGRLSTAARATAARLSLAAELQGYLSVYESVIGQGTSR